MVHGGEDGRERVACKDRSRSLPGNFLTRAQGSRREEESSWVALSRAAEVACRAAAASTERSPPERTGASFGRRAAGQCRGELTDAEDPALLPPAGLRTF